MESINQPAAYQEGEGMSQMNVESPSIVEDEHTRFGELSEIIHAEIDGLEHSIKIYWKRVDENWTLYTSVLEDGSVLCSSESPRFALFDS